MSFEVTLTWEDGGTNTINLHSYGGENLILEDGFSKTVTLHKDLKPVQDKASFSVQARTSLTNTLLLIPADVTVYVDIDKDGSDWFTGHLRPVTSLTITGADDSVIDLEALDNSDRLKKKFASDYTDTSVSVSDAVENLLDAAGYDAAEYSVTTISNTIGHLLVQGQEDTPWKVLEELLFSFGYVFYFDESGVFRVYDFSVESTPSISGTVNDDNIVSELGVDREIDEHDGVEVTFYSVREATGFGSWRVLNRSIFTTLDAGDKYPADGATEFAYTLNQDNNISRIISVSNERAVVSGRAPFGGFAAGEWPYGFSRYLSDGPGTDIASDGFKIGEFTRLSSLGLKGVDLQFKPTNFSDYDVSSITVYADVVYTVERDPFRTNTDAVDPWKHDGQYVFSETDAQRIANILERRLKNSQYRYTIASETILNVGDYVTLQSTDANIDTTARIIKRVDAEANRAETGELVYTYDLEGVAELGSLFGQISNDSGIVILPPSQSNDEGAANGLDPLGNVIKPINGNLLDSSLSPGETGLFMSSDYLGFYDATTGEWVARIENDDGTGKFRVGDSDEYMEWDGDSLNIAGTAQSANYTEGGTEGWQLTSAGKLTAREGEVGGWTIQDTQLTDSEGRVALNPIGRRVEIRDASDVLKIVLGYLSGVSGYDANQYGLYIAPGNAVQFDGGITLGDGDTIVQSDAAITIVDSSGTEAGRFGSIGDGDIGLVIGAVGFRSTITGGGDATSTMTDDLLGGGTAIGFNEVYSFTATVDGGGSATSTMTATVLGGGSATSVMTADLTGGEGATLATGDVPATFGALVGGGPASGVGLRYSQSNREITIRGEVTADNLVLPDLPTSSAGLATGTVYRDGDTLKIV